MSDATATASAPNAPDIDIARAPPAAVATTTATAEATETSATNTASVDEGKDIGTSDKPASAPAGAKPAKGNKMSAQEQPTDVEMKDAPAVGDNADAEPATKPTKDTKTGNVPTKPEIPATPSAKDNTVAPASAATEDKSKARRKSTGTPASTGKKLNKKQSKAKITHTDAKPGEFYFVKLKGHPQWPGVICDEDMLPSSLIKSRPVTAIRPDGTYREDYADGGKRAMDRTFPVMFLSTNEFSWVRNTDLSKLDPETVLASVNDKMRKDLRQAYEIASHAHSLDHFKEVLQAFQEEMDELVRAQQAEEEAEAAAKEAAARKPKKGKSVQIDNEDVDMIDADSDKTSKKRKADNDSAPSDSVKKPKIKLTSSSTKATNGAAKTGDDAKPAKTKKKDGKKVDIESQPAKEPELTPEERFQRKEKEVLFLRHKLQKGLLTRDQTPKAEEMKTMSDFVTKLEGFPDLEVAIIKTTKINKVLKAILKLTVIPKEGEFNFKGRSQALLDKWNVLLQADGTPVPSAPAAAATTNGVNGKPAEATPTKAKVADKPEATNGVKDDEEEAEQAKPAADAKSKVPVCEDKTAAEIAEDDKKPEKAADAAEAAA